MVVRMTGWFWATIFVLSWSGAAVAQGLLVPTDRSIRPLDIVYQRVNVSIKEQAAVTRVEQEFENHSHMALEAHYLFPVPQGAGVTDFAMWVDGKRIKGEMVEAPKARQIYEDIVRRLKDPGILEQMGNNLWRVRVYPVPARGRQKIEISYSEIVKQDSGITQYIYPLRTGNQSVKTRDDFTIRVDVQSNAALKSVYSPSHQVGVTKEGEHKAIVGFEARNYSLDKNFHLYWTTGNQDVGVSMLAFRESPSEAGHFMLLLSPKAELPANARVARDVVFVVDTSGSMQGEKMDQAKRALEFCIKALSPEDRFGMVSFATTTNRFEEKLLPVNADNIRRGVEWVRNLNAVGGTAINDALEAGFALRGGDARNFTMVFMTDGQPTIGEQDPAQILKNVQKRNTNNTRIFVFGVGEDVNAHLLDQVADTTRGTTVYVAANENLEAKVSGFYSKISHPVLSDLAISMGNNNVRLEEIYPPKLPDLFHGSQIIVLGRFQGSGASTIKLTGKLGNEQKEFLNEAMFPAERRDNDFLPALWARRKVGYLLDQIRLGGERKELVDEVVFLAKRFGIATPYTSYLVVPDQSPPAVGNPRPVPFPRRLDRSTPRRASSGGGGGMGGGGGLGGGAGGGFGGGGGGRELGRSQENQKRVGPAGGGGGRSAPNPSSSGKQSSAEDVARSLESLELEEKNKSSREGGDSLSQQAGQEAVDIAVILRAMKDAKSSEQSAAKQVGKTTFLNVNGVWIDSAYKDGIKLVKIKYLSNAYFRLLELNSDAKSVLALGERVVWVTSDGKALVIDSSGKEELPDSELRSLFAK